MPTYVVEGGHRLSGRIRPTGNKNAALPCLTACLLSPEPVTLDNVPRIRDVETLLEIMVSLGCTVDWETENRVRVDAGEVRSGRPDPAQAERIRASLLLAGPLLARFGSVTLPPPGGDVIGRRRMDTHFLAFRGLGAGVTLDKGFTVEAERLEGADVFLDEPSVTGTENAVMAAVRAHGTTWLRNAASGASRPGPLSPPERHGRPHRGHRHEHASHRRRGGSPRRHLPDRGATTSRRGRSWVSPRSRGASW